MARRWQLGCVSSVERAHGIRTVPPLPAAPADPRVARSGAMPRTSSPTATPTRATNPPPLIALSTRCCIITSSMAPLNLPTTLGRRETRRAAHSSRSARGSQTRPTAYRMPLYPRGSELEPSGQRASALLPTSAEHLTGSLPPSAHQKPAGHGRLLAQSDDSHARPSGQKRLRSGFVPFLHSTLIQ